MIRTRPFLAISLFFFLLPIYVMTFRGAAVTHDENILFDLTESFAKSGEFTENIFYDLKVFQGVEDPLAPSGESYEPLQPILASPIFLITQHLPKIALTHAVWLFNALIVSLIVVVFYWGNLTLNFSPLVAWLSAIIFGLGTIIFPYARTFFREPLTSLFMLMVVFLAISARRHFENGRMPWLHMLGIASGLIAGFLAKEIALLLVPALLVLLLVPKRWYVVSVIVIPIMLVLAFLLFSQLDIAGTNRYSMERWEESVTAIRWIPVQDSVQGHIWSPGRSFFLFSPVFFVTPLGLWLMSRRGNWRLAMTIIYLFFSFALTYGFVRREIWWAGIAWGPRYLLPIVPIFALSIVPVVDWVVDHRQQRGWVIAFALLAVISVLVQILGVVVSVQDYYDYLNVNNIIASQDAIWTWQWSPIASNLKLFALDNLDSGWRYSSFWWLLTAGLAAISTVSAWWGFNALGWSDDYQGHIKKFGVLTVILGLLVGAGLYSIADDTRYQGDNVELMALIDQLKDQQADGDVIVLENLSFQTAFMAHYKGSARIYTLPLAPGERYSPGHVPLVTSNNVREQAGTSITNLLNSFLDTGTRIWFVAQFGPFHEFAIRPAELYLARTTFPFTEFGSEDTARIIGFAPAPPITRDSVVPAGYDFEDQLRLLRYEMPAGPVFAPGDTIPIALLWSLLKDLDRDYIVAVHLLEGERLVSQHDSVPQATFGRTSTWQPGRLYRDRHGISLPEDLAPGEYRLQVVVYWWQDPRRLTVTAEDGTVIGDAAPLMTITVEE